MDEFDAVTADLRSEQRLEAEEQAREMLAAADAQTSFGDYLRRVPRGEVVAVTTVDGSTTRSRILRVGADWCRLGEVADELGTARCRARRVHAVRLDAIVRVTREWDR